MWPLIAAVGGLGTILTLAVWALKAYTAKKNADFITQERKAGADEVQNEALNAEIKRVQDAANAGTAVDGVRGQQVDPNDLDQ